MTGDEEWLVYSLTPAPGGGVIAHASDGHGHHLRVKIPKRTLTRTEIQAVVTAAGKRLIPPPAAGGPRIGKGRAGRDL